LNFSFPDFSALNSSSLFEWLGLLSLVTFIGSLLVVPWLILRMEPDYFIRHQRKVIERQKRHPLLTFLLYAVRNVIGFCLFLAGITMLVLPGQGILTILIGLSLMDFPGKHRFFDRMIKIEKIQNSLNWIRQKGNRKNLIFSHDTSHRKTV
jgi:hypothetical protein